LNKIVSNPIIDIKNIEDLKEFRENYGDMNFVVVLNKDKDNEYKETLFYKCVHNLANGNFKHMFYFGIVDKNIYQFNQFDNTYTPSKDSNYKEYFSDIVSVNWFKILNFILHHLYFLYLYNLISK